MTWRMTWNDLDKALDKTGLMLRGGFHPIPDDEVPNDAATVVLVGNAGPDLWQHFDPKQIADPNPLNAWSRRTIDRLAHHSGATALYPFDGPPHYPFQRWAQRADAVYPSPIGPLIHPEYGMWHAYRGALLFAERLELPVKSTTPSPCGSCTDKPCLSTCPVGAFSAAGYDVPACRTHIASAAGADCLNQGCRARRACPIGQDYIYEPAQAAFHMGFFMQA